VIFSGCTAIQVLSILERDAGCVAFTSSGTYDGLEMLACLGTKCDGSALEDWV
jgi:hypothetical protein